MYNAMPILEQTNDWNATIILIIAVIIAILLIAAKLLYPDFYKTTLYRMFVENLSGRQVNKRTDASTITAISTIESFLSISAMIFAVICYSNKTTIQSEYGSEWKIILFILGLFAAYNIAKLTVNKLIGSIFKIEAYTDSYNTLILDTEKILGLAYIPLFTFCPFVSEPIAKTLVWTAIAATFALVGFQFITFFLHLLKNKFLNHYSILYFCALEVIPVLVLIKLAF